MTTNNTLRYIDSCMEGDECPDADLCRENIPESCPLYTDQFELDPDEEVDKAIDKSRFSA